MTTKPDPNAERLAFLEAVIEKHNQGFVAAGIALCEIRDKQLYRTTHDTFAKYVEARWGTTVRRAYQLIAAAAVAANVQHVSQDLNARQADELSKLPANQQAPALAEAIAAGPSLTAEHIRTAVSNRTPKRKLKRRPKPIRIRVPNGIVIVERRSADVDPATLIQAAIDKLSSSTIKVHDAA